MSSALRYISSSTKKLKAWPASVAMPAPLIPISNTKISIGASTTFIMAPEMMPHIAYEAFPWKRIWLLSTMAPIMKGVAIRT